MLRQPRGWSHAKEKGKHWTLRYTAECPEPEKKVVMVVTTL